MDLKNNRTGRIAIRPFHPGSHLEAALALWNASAAAGEVVYAPLDRDSFRLKLLEGPGAAPGLFLVAESEGQLLGSVHGARKTAFLPGEQADSAPGYLTCLFVSPAHRRRGIGSALLAALEDRFRALHHTRLLCAEANPVQLDWLIPGTNGHDHNKAPGVDTACTGYVFLLNRGFAERHREVAMYLNLAEYQPLKDLQARRDRLAAEGIQTGRYDPALSYDYDTLCDRVGSPYWREVLRQELAKAHPRVILAATHQGRMVGFTGPVDKQASGRGWFSGICTDPGFSGRGIATVLFHLLLKEFINIGASFSTLFTGESNPARGIYDRAGFRPVKHFAVMERML